MHAVPLTVRLFLAVCGAVITTTGLSAQIGIGPGGLRADRPATSIKDLRDRNVVKQRFDFSCGAAALATMLHYGFGESVTEEQILSGLFDLPTEDEKAERRRTGFSLLDLQRVAQARGYAAEGFRLEPAQLSMLGGPVIVFIEPRGYKHFAVLRGIRGDRVYLADPSRGNVRLPMHTFLHSWLQDDGRGIIFAVEPKSTPPPGTLTSALPIIAPARHPEVIAAGEMLMISAPLIRPRPSR
jgi:predicted double-glycine peptidase